jgi:hypothetical protein
VTSEPVGQALEQERARAGARRGEESGEGVTDGDRVVAVDGLAREPVRRHQVAHALDVGMRGARRELGEAVVLAHEHDRQLPQRREVHRLGPVPGLHGAVAEEHDGHLVAAAQATRERAAERHRHVAADHAGGAEQAVLDVDQVHRAAKAAAEAAFAAHQLRHHRVERGALRDRVPVRAVAAVDRVVVPELPADGRRHSLLADAQVDQAVDLVGPLELPDPLLEHPDPPHRAEQLERIYHPATEPASTGIAVPVTNEASSEHSQTTAAATSAGSPKRSIACGLRISC